MYSLNILLMLAIPIALGIFLVRKFYLEGRWWWMGAAVYVISQIVLVPLQNYVINPYLNRLNYSGNTPSINVLIFGGVLLGLCTGVCEETFRYVTFRWWANDARSFESGLLLGTGQGGAASIILALLVLYNFINMAIVRNMDIATIAPANQVSMIQSQISAFWSVPWYYTLREAISQTLIFVVEISLAIIVLQAITRKQWYWLLVAIGFHALMEGSRLVALNLLNDYMTDVVLGLFAILGVVIVLWLWRLNASVNISPIEQNENT